MTTPSGVRDTFVYNGLGLRVGKTDSTGSYSYLCDGASPASPVLWDGHAIYTPGLSENRGGSSAYYDNDRLGNLWTLDGAGKSQWTYEDTSGFGSLIAGGRGATPFGFGGGNGCQSDADTGLVLMGHRYLDTRIGRFITQDPAGSGDNWYAYAGNSPVNAVDPSGLMSAPTGAGMWGINGGTSSDAAMALGSVEGDAMSSNNTWAEVLHLYLWRATDHHNGQGYQVDGEWPLWNVDGAMFADHAVNERHPGESDAHYFFRGLWWAIQQAFTSGADPGTLGAQGPPSAGLFGGNPNVAKNQINTNAPGGRAAAKSLFRKLSKGQRVINGAARDGSIRRYTEDGSVQIRMKSNGTTNVDI